MGRPVSTRVLKQLCNQTSPAKQLLSHMHHCLATRYFC